MTPLAVVPLTLYPHRIIQLEAALSAQLLPLEGQ